MQMLAPIPRDARVENVVMAALDDVDGVNLQVAQMRHRCRRGLRAGAEGFVGVQALRMQPDSAGLDGGELDKRILQFGLWWLSEFFQRKSLIDRTTSAVKSDIRLGICFTVR